MVIKNKAVDFLYFNKTVTIMMFFLFLAHPAFRPIAELKCHRVASVACRQFTKNVFSPSILIDFNSVFLRARACALKYLVGFRNRNYELTDDLIKT